MRPAKQSTRPAIARRRQGMVICRRGAGGAAVRTALAVEKCRSASTIRLAHQHIGRRRPRDGVERISQSRRVVLRHEHLLDDPRDLDVPGCHDRLAGGHRLDEHRGEPFRFATTVVPRREAERVARLIQRPQRRATLLPKNATWDCRPYRCDQPGNVDRIREESGPPTTHSSMSSRPKRCSTCSNAWCPFFSTK